MESQHCPDRSRGLCLGLGPKEDAGVTGGNVRAWQVRAHASSFPALSSQGRCGHLLGWEGQVPREAESKASLEDLFFCP